MVTAFDRSLFERLKKGGMPYFLIVMEKGKIIEKFIEGKEFCFQDYETPESFCEDVAKTHRELEAKYPSPGYYIGTACSATMLSTAETIRTYP